MSDFRQKPDFEDFENLPLRDFLSYRLTKVGAKVSAQGARKIREVSGLSLAQWRILALVGSMENNSASGLIQDDLMDKGLFSRNSRFLVDAGFLSQEIDPKDHRSKKLSLTSSGRELHDRILPRMRERQKGLLSCLTPKEREALYSALEKIEKHVES